MAGLDRLQYDFNTNQWVRDDFLSPAPVLESSKQALGSMPPRAGAWNSSPVRKGLSTHAFQIRLLQVAGLLLCSGVCWWSAGLGAIGLLMLYIWSNLSVGQFLKVDPTLYEDPDDLEVCQVEITIYASRQRISKDQGILFFDQNRLCFNGRRTSFALGGQDILPKSKWHLFELSTSRSPSDDVIPLMIGDYLMVRPLVRRCQIDEQREIRMRRKILAFLKNPPFATADRQLPPFRPKP